MLDFKPVNLDCFVAFYNGRKIEIKQRHDKMWSIFVNGKLTNKGPFVSKRYAINCVEVIIEKLERESPDFIKHMESILNVKPRFLIYKV